jgi:hypothetical protein
VSREVNEHTASGCAGGRECCELRAAGCNLRVPLGLGGGLECETFERLIRRGGSSRRSGRFVCARPVDRLVRKMVNFFSAGRAHVAQHRRPDNKIERPPRSLTGAPTGERAAGDNRDLLRSPVLAAAVFLELQLGERRPAKPPFPPPSVTGMCLGASGGRRARAE